MRKVDARTGTITTVLGSAYDEYPDEPVVDGAVGTQVQIFWPRALAVDEGGNVWVAEATSAGRILKLDPQGRIHIAAGAGYMSGAGVASPPLHGVNSLAVGPDGSVYFAEYFGARVGRLNPDGTVRSVAGTQEDGFRDPTYLVDGQPAVLAPVNRPVAVALSRDGTLYINESGGRILRVAADGVLRVVVGRSGDVNINSGYPRPVKDGTPALGIVLSDADDMTVLPDGTVAFVELGSRRIRGLVPGGALPPIPPGITWVGGTGAGKFTDGTRPAAASTMRYPRGMATAADGSVFVADTGNHRIRRVNLDGTMSTVAGNGTVGFTGDGPATKVGLNRPRSVAVDPQGRVVIADTDNARIRRLDPATGQLTTIAGDGRWGFGGDGGAATAASLAGPQGVAVAADGTIYVADTRNGRVRRIGTDGVITTIAQAGLRTPRNLNLSADGATLYVADDGTDTVTALTLATGALRTVATLANPDAMVVDGADLIVAEPGANVVVRISPDGTRTVVAGTGADADRHATGAPLTVDLSTPQGLTRMPDGSIWVTDTGHNRIVRLTL